MLSGVLADAVLVFHFLFILFAVFGGFLVLYKGKVLWFHLPVVLWSSVVNCASLTCPLTPIEIFFRNAAGQAGYQGGFVEHYIAPIVYPAGMPRELELVAGVSIIAWNVAVYGFLGWKSRIKAKK
jgi:hypothetical protein